MPTAYITSPPDVAASLARMLVDERLAACVNQVSCNSVYRWDGDVHEDDEVILLAKTTEERYADVRERVREEHPYEVPCIERFDETDVDEAFGEWIDVETQF